MPQSDLVSNLKMRAFEFYILLIDNLLEKTRETISPLEVTAHSASIGGRFHQKIFCNFPY